MAQVSDQTLPYLSQEPIFTIGEDEGDDELQFLQTPTLNLFDPRCPTPVDAEPSDSDSNHSFDSESDANSDVFYNVFYADVPEEYLRGSEATDDVVSGALVSDGAQEELGFGSRSVGESSCGTIVESRADGLRVAGIGSDSESEENEDDGFGVDSNNGDDEMDPIDVLDCGIRWDSPQVDDGRVSHEYFEWEEVNERRDDEREAFGMLIDGVEQMSVSSAISFEENSTDGIGDELVRNFEWAVLLSVNNLESEGYLSVLDDTIFVEDYDAIIRLFADDEIGLNGNPPAAKSVVDNLQVAVLKREDLGNYENVLCAVCKDEIELQEKVKKLPCCHCFHGECILPWLSIRNTCPVCRYELPTDDPAYESRKGQRVGGPGP